MSRRSRLKQQAQAQDQTAPIPIASARATRTQRLDSFINTITGLGDATRNKTAGIMQQWDGVLDPVYLESLFMSSDLAWKTISALPQEAMKDGFGLTTPAGDDAPEDVAEQAQEIMDAAERLGLSDKTLEAACWGRGYGFGGLVLGIVGAGKPDEPYDDEDPSGRLSWTMVTDHRWMQALTYYDDPAEDKYGEVKTYQITPSNTGSNQGAFVVHETRVVRFPGAMTSLRERQRNAGADYSVMQRVNDVLQQTAQNWEAVCQLMADMSQGVFTVEGLIDTLASGNETTLLTRMKILDMTRSVGRAIVLDSKTEKFERVQTPMAGVNEAILRTWERYAAAADTPIIVLFGISAAGLGDTGQSLVRIWYDKITRQREHVIAPRLLRVCKLISRDLGHANWDDWRITWPSLWKSTPSESADIYFKFAQADKIYMDAGVVLAEEVALGRMASGDEFNTGKLQIDAEARKEAMKAAIAELKDPTPPPAPVIVQGKPQQQLPGKSVPALTAKRADEKPLTRGDELNQAADTLRKFREADAPVDDVKILEELKIPKTAIRPSEKP